MLQLAILPPELHSQQDVVQKVEEMLNYSSVEHGIAVVSSLATLVMPPLSGSFDQVCLPSAVCHHTLEPLIKHSEQRTPLVEDINFKHQPHSIFISERGQPLYNGQSQCVCHIPYFLDQTPWLLLISSEISCGFYSRAASILSPLH